MVVASRPLRVLVLLAVASLGPLGVSVAGAEAPSGQMTLFTYGTYPDIEGLIRKQATEPERAKREAILHRAQQLMHEKVMYAPLLELAIPGGYGPRVAESGIGLITNMSSSAPYEDLRLKGK